MRLLPSVFKVSPSLHQDDEEFDDDYESPYSGDEEGSGGDYESPNDDPDGANDYEPPPSEPPEDMVRNLCPTLPIGDSDYIGNTEGGGLIQLLVFCSWIVVSIAVS